MTSPHKRIFKMMETSGPCGPCEPCESMEVVEHQSSHDAEFSVLLSRRVADRQTDCLQHEAQQVCVMWSEITHRFILVQKWLDKGRSGESLCNEKALT